MIDLDMHIKVISGKTTVEFIRKQNTGRIRQVSCDFYRNANEHDFISLGLYSERGTLLGISSSSWDSQYGITLIRTINKNKGYGKMLLTEKVKRFKDKNIPYKTLVADDNEPSKKMCLSVGLTEIKRETLTRRNGEQQYIGITFSTK
jgi:hypothetical protein